MKFKKIPIKYFQRSALDVAPFLLGKLLVRRINNNFLVTRIVETEAYLNDDPASHSFGRITERNKAMYDAGGQFYVYFIYGNYFCVNVVTNVKGHGEAVLVRAVEPVSGIGEMIKNRRNIKNEHDLTSGPGKLCMALNIDKTFYGARTDGEDLFIAYDENPGDFEIGISKRIGLSVSKEIEHRFFIKGNKFVTKHKFNN
ncbi:MAG: DNA-3-methyladenine glycosylase [Ignavibacteria bacterium]|nr:DNA-3-methyladenine glycosylase [Ignavibacteria bacterium]